MEKLIEILGTQGILGLAFLIAIALVFLTGYLYKREDKKSDKSTIDVAVLQKLSASLAVIEIHVEQTQKMIEQSQRINERHDQTLLLLNTTMVTLTGIVENTSNVMQGVQNAFHDVKTSIALLLHTSGNNNL